MTETKKSKSIVIVGIYLISIGIVFGCFGLSSTFSHNETSQQIYRGAVGRIASLVHDTTGHEFKNIADKNEYIYELNDLKTFTKKWISRSRSPQYQALCYIFVVTTSILYIFSGMRILRISRIGIKYFNLAGCGVIVYLILFMADYPYFILITLTKVVKISKIIDPTYNGTFIAYIALIQIVVILIFSAIYILIPKVLINRLRIKSQLV